MGMGILLSSACTTYRLPNSVDELLLTFWCRFSLVDVQLSVRHGLGEAIAPAGR